MCAILRVPPQFRQDARSRSQILDGLEEWRQVYFGPGSTGYRQESASLIGATGHTQDEAVGSFFPRVALDGAHGLELFEQFVGTLVQLVSVVAKIQLRQMRTEDACLVNQPRDSRGGAPMGFLFV